MDIENCIASAKDIKAVEEIRAKINESCNNRIKVINLANRANEIASKPFGYLKETFENMSPDLFETKKGKALIGKYTSTIKGNNSLSNLHVLHENVRKTNANASDDFFINNITSVDWNINKKELNEGKEAIGKIVAEAYITLGEKGDIYLPKENSLYSALEFIAENKKTPKNLSEYAMAAKIIKEHVAGKEASENIFENRDLDTIASRMIREFNSKYDGKLSADEVKLITKISTSNGEIVFEEYKKNCLEALNEAKKNYTQKGDTESFSKVSEICEMVNGKSFNSDTVYSDIINLMEMAHVFED